MTQMMIIDYSQVCVSSYFAVAGYSGDNQEMDEDFIRHVILDSLRTVIYKFKRDYPDIVIAVDGKNTWRKAVFPYYKANRKEAKEKAKINWQDLYKAINAVKQNLKDIFPYKVIEVEGAEADDIIGTLTRHATEPVLIISGDHDFIQLQANGKAVKQWDKINDRWLYNENPKKYLFSHVLTGDKGDGIPNALSPADSFVTKTRQKPCGEKKINELWEDPSSLLGNERFLENRKLIDLKFTPKDIQLNIIEAYTTYKTNDRSQLLNFMVRYGMRKLAGKIGDF